MHNIHLIYIKLNKNVSYDIFKTYFESHIVEAESGIEPELTALQAAA
jgi:hypothetical protein